MHAINISYVQYNELTLQAIPEQQKPKKKERIIPEEGQPEWVNFSLKPVKAEPRAMEPEEMETVDLKPIPDVEEEHPTETKPKEEKLQWESLELKPIESMDRPVLEKPTGFEAKPLKKKKKRSKKPERPGEDEFSDADKIPEDEQTLSPDFGPAPEVCRAFRSCVKQVQSLVLI